MKVLFVASEAHPFIKVGGLGDVAHALPKALRKLGVDVRVILPKYGSIKEEVKSEMVNIAQFNIQLGWRNQYCGLQYMEYDDIPFYFIDNEYYFKRENAYGYFDDGERFSFFDKAVIESMRYMEGFTPHVIHCNDWHSGAIIPLLSAFYSDKYKNIKTLFTVHNLQYQGVFPREVLGELLGLGDEYFVDERLKFNGAISFMKGALNMADKISTVSSTYAEEIKTSYYGEGLDSLLWYRKHDLSGIVNGIDTDIYNPETDKELAFNFNKNDFSNKLKNKRELQAELNLTVNENIPMIGIVSRLVSQKGFDLIARVLDEILELDLQLVLLGTGEHDFEQMFKHYARKYPKKVSSNILFNNKLAKKIYASSDMFLMPSKFEPCGIGQLLALRYGTIPIVRETGGLKDTVTNYNKITGEGNGFSFSNYNAHDMLYKIQEAVKLYKDKALWNRLVKAAMSEDNSWTKSAEVYIDLYNTMMK